MADSKKKLPKFRIRTMFLGIPIGFNTGKFVQELDCSDEVAGKLLARHKPETIFSIYPKSLKGKRLQDFIDKYNPKPEANPKSEANPTQSNEEEE